VTGQQSTFADLAAIMADIFMNLMSAHTHTETQPPTHDTHKHCYS